MSYEFELKYKVGDIVKVRDDLIIDETYGLNKECYFAEGMEMYKGALFEVLETNAYGKKDFIILGDHEGNQTGFTWTVDMLEGKAECFKSLKTLLNTGAFGITNSGQKFVIIGDRLVFQNGKYDYIYNFDDMLNHGDKIITGLTQSTHCHCFGEVEEELEIYNILECCKYFMGRPKEMTLSEIENILGYKIKLVNEVNKKEW